METVEKSPIIERLCNFMEYSGLSNSQFADKAGIPRPSLSQMLHGRNKSLNNQVLEKLNEAFPELNIVWLLFGHGEMVDISKIEFSERQNMQNSQQFVQKDIDFEDFDEFQTSVLNDQQSTSNGEKSLHSGNEPQIQAIIDTLHNSGTNQDNASKKISSIIVLYTDNSFGIFHPSKD